MRFMVISILEDGRGKLKWYSSEVSLNHQARDTKAEEDMLATLFAGAQTILQPRIQDIKGQRENAELHLSLQPGN